MTHAVDTKDLAISALRVMATEDEVEFARLVHPARHQPRGDRRATRLPGQRAVRVPRHRPLVARRVLRPALGGARRSRDGDLVVLHGTMSGRHTGPFVAYGPDARPKVAFPATGRAFAVTQTHWFRIADGQVIEHWANRDDRGMGEQLGWTPPSPGYLVRMLLATRRAAPPRPDLPSAIAGPAQKAARFGRRCTEPMITAGGRWQAQARRARYAATATRFPHVVLQNRRERLRERSSTIPSHVSSAQIASRDSSSARMRSTIAMAVSTATRTGNGVSGPTACRW